METLELYDCWAAGYLLASGARLLKVVSTPTVLYVFDNRDGQGMRALNEWKLGRCLVHAKAYASAMRAVRRAYCAAMNAA